MFEAAAIAQAVAFLKKNWKRIAAVLLIVVILSLTFCAGKNHAVMQQQAQTIKTQQKVGTANEKAADTRVQDQARTDQQKQELQDAISNSSSNDDARRRTGCAILRQQGRDVSAIPACR